MYKPRHFRTPFDTPLGQDLWRYLNGELILRDAITATRLRRPVVEALQWELLDKFGDSVREDRMKQMIGHMVRQVMKNNGFVLDQTGVRIPRGPLFTSGARYRRIED